MTMDNLGGAKGTRESLEGGVTRLTMRAFPDQKRGGGSHQPGGQGVPAQSDLEEGRDFSKTRLLIVGNKDVVEGYPGKSGTRNRPTNFFLKFSCKGKNYDTMSELKPQDGRS
jgi:hypothetical protein